MTRAEQLRGALLGALIIIIFQGGGRQRAGSLPTRRGRQLASVLPQCGVSELIRGRHERGSIAGRVDVYIAEITAGFLAK